MATRSRRLRKQRGAAMVEFALTVPIFFTMLFWSSYLLEIVRMRLKLQEAARFAVWEVSSYSLSDYETSDHPAAYTKAHDAIMKDVNERYKDFDSIEPNQKAPFYSTYGTFTATMKNEDVPPVASFFPGASGGLGEFANAISGFLSQGMNGVLGFWKFDTKGRVEVEVEGEMKAPFMPKGYNDTSVGLNQKVNNWGGKDLSSRKMKAKFAMVASGWHLKDGSEARFSKPFAGVRDEDNNSHQLRAQVGRMTYGGIGNLLSSIPGISTVKSFMSFIVPLPIPPDNAYVVSKSYLPEGDVASRNCGNINHPNQSGMMNLHSEEAAGALKDGDNTGPGLDYEDNKWLRCFDTAPFRDQVKTDDSLYIKLWKQRGEFGFGCKQEQATDPTWTAIQGGEKATPYACQ